MKKITYLILIALVIIIACILQWFTCCNCQGNSSNKTVIPMTSEVKEEVVKPEVTKFPFTVSDGDFTVNVNDNFNFKGSSYNFETPVSENVDDGIEKIKNYVSEKKDKEIHITGFYTKDEGNNSIYPNLGVARAISVKNYFVKKGIPSQLINTYGESKDDLVPENDLFYGAVKFGLPTVKAEETEDLPKLLAEINASPLVVYFQTGKVDINLTEEQRLQISKISHYLDKVDGAICLAVGHTDNTGDAAKNKILGKQRAEFVKQYLVKNSIPLSKIQTDSKGELEPIAPNDRQEGKSKNRRTVITIKKQ